MLVHSPNAPSSQDEAGSWDSNLGPQESSRDLSTRDVISFHGVGGKEAEMKSSVVYQI